MVSPDAASEIACPMVAQAVAFVLQLLPSSPLTPLTYHVPASAGEHSAIRAPRTLTTLPLSMATPPGRICLRKSPMILTDIPQTRNEKARFLPSLPFWVIEFSQVTPLGQGSLGWLVKFCNTTQG